MATHAQLVYGRTPHRVVLRIGAGMFAKLRRLLFSRYPELEWASFGRCGWRETPTGLVLTLAVLDPPAPTELDDNYGHVVINESYSLRMALTSEQHRLAVTVIHSHPKECRPLPSLIDDDMDGYYADYFGGFAPKRPYISIIVSEVNGEIGISGRIYWDGSWLRVNKVCVEQTPVTTWPLIAKIAKPARRNRLARLTSAFGDEAEQRLRQATVAVVGAGGTGSAAIEILARAGIGRLVIADPDYVEESNLERIHGGWPLHAKNRAWKVEVARSHVHSIDPSIEVIALVGALPQAEVVDHLLEADVALGCTDQQHSRLALSELGFRFLLPSIDCGVTLEGADGRVTGQIFQLVRFLTTDPCVLCRKMINPQRLSQEMMSPEERKRRLAAAENAQKRNEDPDPYWLNVPQINTVGYLTTVAGAMAAAYAIGWITGRFEPPFSRLQGNLVAKFLDVTDVDDRHDPICVCTRVNGWSNQASAEALITVPRHWPPVQSI